MANVKNFGLSGVGSDLQLGKGGTRLVSSEGVFNFKTASGTVAAALTAAGITSASGDVTLTTGNLVLSSQAGSVKIGGIDIVKLSAGGLPQVAGVASLVIPASVTADRGVGVLGSVRINSDDALAATAEYFDGTQWSTLANSSDLLSLEGRVTTVEGRATDLEDRATAVEGRATGLETMTNGIATTLGLGYMDNAFDAAAFAGTSASTATSFTDAINKVALAAAGKDSLDELFGSLAAGNVIYSNGSNVWAQAAPGATSGVQAYDAGLAALAAKTSTGIMVQTGADTFESRSLVAPAEGFTITDADGVAGAPTFVLANDLGAIEALTGTGFAVRTGTDTWAQRSITGTAGNIVVTNGDGVTSSPTLDLAAVEQAATGTFSKVTLDAFGRVVGNTAVTTSDITALVDGNYVDITGDTMTGNLTMNGGTVTGLPTPVAASDAANKAYVDNAVTGLTWKNAVAVMAVLPVVLAGQANLVDGVALATGDRVLLTAQATATENGIYVATVSGANVSFARATDADTTAELQGAAVFVKSGTAADSAWVQTDDAMATYADQQWTQFSGAGAYTGGTGITVQGTTITANLGAGVTDLPTGEIGLDIVAGQAIQLTTLATAGQLTLVLGAAGGLAQSIDGLKIDTAGVTNAMLANSAFSIDADSGTGSVSLGGTLNVIGDAAQGISTAVNVSNDIVITAADATTTAKGVASFNTASFTVDAGAVSLNVVDVAHGGTGASSFTADQLIFGNGTSALAQSANLTFSTDTLTVGGALPIAINGETGSIAATATNGDLVLMPNGTGSVIVGPVGAGLIQSDAATALTVRGNTTLTLEAGTGNVVLQLATASKVTVSGPTAVEYATGLAASDLVNKQYVDTAIFAGAASGSIKAVKLAGITAGTTAIGAAMPAGATVLSVKIVVTTADATGEITVGKASSAAAYMTAGESDASATGIYMAETYVTEAAAEQVSATVTGTGVYTVIAEYQVA